MKYLVDVYRQLGQTIEVEADSREKAEDKAWELATNGELSWSFDMLLEDTQTEVCGEVNEKGEREYY